MYRIEEKIFLRELGTLGIKRYKPSKFSSVVIRGGFPYSL